MKIYLRSKTFSVLLLALLSTCESLSAVPVFQHFEDIQSLKSQYIKSMVEDQYGYIWIGTIKGVYKFRNRELTNSPTNKLLHDIHIQDLFIDDQNHLWIGTRNEGLFVYKNNTLSKVESNEHSVDSVTKIYATKDNQIWIGSNKGLFTISKNSKLMQPKLKSANDMLKKKVTALSSTESGDLIVGSEGVFHLVNFNDDMLSSVNLEKDEYIHDLHVDHEDSIWIATSNKLRKFRTDKNEFVVSPKLPGSTRVLSIQQFESHLWVASIDGGIYNIDITTNKVNQYTHDKNHSFSLSENHIGRIYISNSNHLWVGNFSGGLSVLDLNQLKFGFQTNIEGSISCARDSKIIEITVENGKVWLGTDHGLIEYDPKYLTCRIITSNNIEENYAVYSRRKDKELTWLSTSIGLLEYHETSNSISKTIQTDQFSVAFFSLKKTDHKFIVGTDKGLFEYSLKNKSYRKYETLNSNVQNKRFLKYAINNKNQLLLPSLSGLLYLNNDNILEHYPRTLNTLKNQEIIGIHINNANELFTSVRNKGVYHFDSNHTLKVHYFDEGIFSSFNDIPQIQSAKDSDVVWLGSKKGLIQLNTKTNERHLFSGTSKNNYLSLFQSSFNYEDKIFFAGDSGYVGFENSDINNNNRTSSFQISQLSLANTIVEPNQKTKNGFVLNSPIEETKKLSFNHRDKLIKLDLSNLNFYNHHSVSYAYKLEPVISEWITLDSRDNNLTFTHLESGNYELLIRTTNRDQAWSNEVKSIAIKIRPAPWFSWWAYLSYFLIAIFLVYLYVKQKTKNQIKTNKYLNTQVKKQTLHIENQKKELESLIERKDEIFSNVSHEFRTPITLIQGPISELRKQEKNKNKVKMLQMVERNSNRLLRLVNQMLELSNSVENNVQQKTAIKLAVRLELIAEPYFYHAQKCDINFTYGELHDVTIQATTDALELTIGNFLSNAFKYTQPKGEIHLGTEVTNGHIRIFVKDNGQGFEEGQKDRIFKRFGRLSHHRETEGVGIGLAIVKEIAALNNAEVTVESEPGNGSIFSIVFPVDDFSVVKGKEDPLAVINTVSQKPTLLIIEDNRDMRLHMNNILKQNFSCLLESNGKDGIATAIKSVPDIIISDVMMPEVNGFQVCRILRNELITSHIPLVLLTALTDKPSRIKGWQEGIDLYIDKPFDAEELILQLKNILKVRNILNEKNQRLIKKDIYSELLQIDKDFVIKLKNIIKDNYKDSSFGLASMVNLMFVSEKQLQRKTKALLNLSPLAVLREYRFEQALSSLRKGYQVSVTSDNCGFSSVSYFSQMFKQKYGMTPKQYQSCNKEVNNN